MIRRGAHVADAAIFDRVASELEARSSLSRLEARGTLRLALKEAGLDPRTVSTRQMKVVIERVLGRELRKRRVEDADALCAGLVTDVCDRVERELDPDADTAYEVFERLESGRPRIKR